MIYRIKTFLSKVLKVVVPAAIIIAIFELLGVSEAIIITCIAILSKMVSSSHKKLHDTIMKVHKNNIDNQKSLMKEIKRCQDEKV